MALDDSHRVSLLPYHYPKVVPGVGGFTHGAWRAFETERKVTDARNFIDGDHVETFLDLTPADAAKVLWLGS